jgi:hypothetical protein
MMIEAKKSREDYFEGRGSCSDIGKKPKRMETTMEHEFAIEN